MYRVYVQEGVVWRLRVPVHDEDEFLLLHGTDHDGAALRVDSQVLAGNNSGSR